MESNWRWNGWVVGGNIGPWWLAARLAEPYLGFYQAIGTTRPSADLLSYLRLDADDYVILHAEELPPAGTRFPFGKVVTQERLVL